MTQLQKTPRPDAPLSLQLAAITLGRLSFNLVWRMVYPFAPALARGLGVEITAVYQLITIRNFIAFLSPIFGPLSERYGRKPVLMGTMSLFVVACLLLVLWPTYAGLGVAIAVIALAKFVYDPAMQAHVGDAVPYRQRGKAIALTETSWSLALLLGAPLIGFILSRGSWQSPFFWLAGLGATAVVLLWRFVPTSARLAGASFSLRRLGQVLAANPVVWAAVAHGFLLMLANEIFFIVYGDWMETSFSLALTSLGLASGVIGGAEIVGELLAGWSVDRLGKRAVIMVTGVLTAVLYALIPFLAVSLTSALVLLAALFVFFEITVVGGIPLLTEIVPSARSVVMALVLGAGALGRAFGSILGPLLDQWGGFLANGIAAAVIMVAAVLVLVFGIMEATEA